MPSDSRTDPRGLRFAAAVTTVVLIVVLATGNVWVLAAQAMVFLLGVFGASPYGLVFASVIRPRLGPPAELEDAAPPRFAQGVGLVFALAGIVGFIAQSPPLAYGATACALLAAFLNAAFGLCLGCQMYLILRRLLPTTR